MATGDIVKEIVLTRNLISFHFDGNLLVFVFRIRESEHFLSVWYVENSVKLTHIGRLEKVTKVTFSRYKD